jgi:hypothetical protein
MRPAEKLAESLLFIKRHIFCSNQASESEPIISFLSPLFDSLSLLFHKTPGSPNAGRIQNFISRLILNVLGFKARFKS